MGLLGTAAQAAGCAGGFSTRFRLAGQVQTPETLRLADLQAMPLSRATITFVAGTSVNTQTYVGVPLIDLLNDAVIVTDPNTKNDILKKYVEVQGSDCYRVIIAVGDLLSNFGHQDVLVAYATGDGTVLGPTEGMARLIIVNDKQGGRLVSNVASITVRSAP
jgi:DMSO/TMAO reductase YedYZ molybdopterin-dependent catalytic subunit